MKIIKPTLLLDKEKCLRNIRRIKSKADSNNLSLRPHFKTHQSIEIGKWFSELGIEKITVSSVDMAEYFSDAGWKDITVAFPVNYLEWEKINRISEKSVLNLLFENEESVEKLDSLLSGSVNAFIKIDAGYHRAGIDDRDIEEIEKVASAIEKSENISLIGILTHSGHTYHAEGPEEIIRIHKDVLSRMNRVKEFLMKKYGNILLSIGDTPSISLAEDFEGVDEIRPGNFVFYDVMQAVLGSCSFEDIAVALASPVVAKHNKRNEIIVYGGGVHLSKERITDKNGKTIYGYPVRINNEGWGAPIPDAFVKGLSQEHGIIEIAERDMDSFNVGDIIGILPVHSCLTANLIKEYFTTENKLITMLK